MPLIDYKEPLFTVLCFAVHKNFSAEDQESQTKACSRFMDKE